MKIYLIRHAETKHRDSLSYQEGYGVGLTRLGRFQAKCLGRWLRRRGAKITIASPMGRTMETAKIASDISGTVVVQEKRFEEYAPSRTLKGKDFKIAKKMARENFDFCPKDGDSVNGSVQRFLEGIEDALKKYNGDIYIIAHALIIQNTLMKLSGTQKLSRIDEVSITTLELSRKNYTVKTINQSPSIWNSLASKIKRRVMISSDLWE